MKEYTNKELEKFGYELSEDMDKCPVCGRVLVTYQSSDIKGNLFCFYDDCSFDRWTSHILLNNQK